MFEISIPVIAIFATGLFLCLTLVTVTVTELLKLGREKTIENKSKEAPSDIERKLLKSRVA